MPLLGYVVNESRLTALRLRSSSGLRYWRVVSGLVACGWLRENGPFWRYRDRLLSGISPLPKSFLNPARHERIMASTLSTKSR